MADRLFHDRREAGRVLARLLDRYRGRPPGARHPARGRPAGGRAGESSSSSTRALEPLERTARWEQGEVPETYPFTV
jgi:hypothetical protein